MWATLKDWARALKSEALTLWFCCKHPRTPLLPRVLALAVVGYALSPIDLIPDFIPVLGYLDDLILLPGAVYLILKLIPEDVLGECRAQAADWSERHRPAPRSYVAAAAIMAIWIAALALAWHRYGSTLLQAW